MGTGWSFDFLPAALSETQVNHWIDFLRESTIPLWVIWFKTLWAQRGTLCREKISTWLMRRIINASCSLNEDHTFVRQGESLIVVYFAENRAVHRLVLAQRSFSLLVTDGKAILIILQFLYWYWIGIASSLAESSKAWSCAHKHRSAFTFALSGGDQLSCDLFDIKWRITCLILRAWGFGERIKSLNSCWRTLTICALLTVRHNIEMRVGQGCQMAHIEVTMNFLKSSKFMSEMASTSVLANFLTVESAAVLALVLIVREFLLLL